MGPMCFDYGYGPFRWVCLSGKAEDLHATDQAAMACIDPTRRGQDRDNWQWIHDAETNALVVGTQARILYADAEGRTEIARRFNKMVRDGEIGPVMMGRDHHDTGGTDSPYRETANIYDGSNTVADMSHQCWAGNAARGMTMAVLSNGGGVGTGKAVNGGFGLVLDGSERVDRILDTALEWDAMGGVARRAWARNDNAIETVDIWNRANAEGVTVPRVAEDELLERLTDPTEAGCQTRDESIVSTAASALDAGLEAWSLGNLRKRDVVDDLPLDLGIEMVAVIARPPSRDSSITSALIRLLTGFAPAFSSPSDNAIEKHPASAAPMTSSGLLPSSPSKRFPMVNGISAACSGFMDPLPMWRSLPGVALAFRVIDPRSSEFQPRALGKDFS